MSNISSQTQSTSGLSRGFIARLAILVLAFCLEKQLLGYFADFDLAQAARGLGEMLFLVYRWGERFLGALVAAITIFGAVRGAERLLPVVTSVRDTAMRPRWMVTHLLLVTALVPVSYLLYHHRPALLPLVAVVALAVLLAAAAAWSAFAAMAPWVLWLRLVRGLGMLWLYAAIAAVVGTCAWQWSQRLWAASAAVTFSLVRWLLLPIVPTLIADPAQLSLSTDRFGVQIDELCSGLEGVGFMLAFGCAWLFNFRKEYIFPRALLLVPAGLLLIFTLNVLRIAALVLIAYAGLPDVAEYGFHSQAGWIAVITVAGALAFVSQRSAWLNRSAARFAPAGTTENPTASYLLPLLAILAAGTAAQAASSGFESLYPLRLIAGAVMLWLCRHRLELLNWQFSWRGPAVGVLIFLIWMVADHLVVPAASMPNALAALSPAYRVAWIACRTLAAVVTVPIAEELAYRGYLLRRLIDADFESVSFLAVRWPSLLITAVVFGFAHGSLWLPGIVAGLGYGAILVRSGRMGEAVAAHAVTNVLIAASVLFWNQWQLW